MALEKPDATQLCSWAPPLPQRAFPIMRSGTSSDAATIGGLAVEGVQYGYMLLNTTAWKTYPTLPNFAPMNVGERFQLCTAAGSSSFPFVPGFATGEVEAPTTTAGSGTDFASAPDLFNVPGMIPQHMTVKDPTLYCVVASGYNSNSSWYIYYAPYNPNVTIVPTTDGIMTWPELMEPKWLGQIGHVANLDYSYAVPGGPDQLSCLLEIEPNYRTDALNPGRYITAHRGGSCVWEGILTEPTPATTGWTLNANGCGTYGTNYGAWWELDDTNTWSLDDPVNFAIARGLRWQNPGLINPGNAAYLGPVQDPGSITITDFLNLVCTGGLISWNLTPPASAASMPPGPWVLQIFSLPTDTTGNPIASAPSAQLSSLNIEFGHWQRGDLTTLSRRPPDLYIVNTNPIGRTIAADINTIILYYQVSADTEATTTEAAIPAVFDTTFADIPQGVAMHGRLEYYLDISSAGNLTRAQAQQIGDNVLSKYIRANFSGSFSVMPGQMLNVGGFPVDLGCNWGGYMASVQVEGFAAGGEVGFGPMTFQIGEYDYNDETQTATVTPYQNMLTDISSVVAALYPGQFT